MQALNTQNLIDQLHDAGLSLVIGATGKLAVAPATNLTDTLRGLIRSNRDNLIDWLRQAANDELITKKEEQPTPKRAAVNAYSPDAVWRVLDRAYLMHHFNCKACQSAGQGRGLRCGTGAALWVDFSNAVMRTGE